MATTEELIKHRDDLTKARFQGARSVQFGERVVTFRSDAEMAALVVTLDRQIAGTSPITTVRITSSKGL